MKVIEVSARKGGVGTSTVAVSIAVALSQANPESVLLLDTCERGDTFAIAGIPFPSSGERATFGTHQLAIAKASEYSVVNTDLSSYSFVVVDAGNSQRAEYFGVVPFRLSVVTNSYLSLRAETLHRDSNPDGVVCVHNPDLVLTRTDVRIVLGVPIVHYFGVDEAVSRAIDAGLYDQRYNLFAEWTHEFLTYHKLSETISA